MAISTNVKTAYGENKDLYVRINDVTVSNHNEPASVRLRGFVNRDAYLSGNMNMFEDVMQVNVDITKPLWDQLYAEVKRKYPSYSDC